MSEREPGPAGDDWTRRRLLGTLGGLAIGGALLSGPTARTVGPVRAVADVTPLGSAAGLAAPSVLDCAGWEARPPSRAVTELAHQASRVIVHHTATANRARPLPVLARAIQQFHMNTNGWIDSGHHFLVDKSGRIAEGRHRSLEALLDGQYMIEGAHCPDQNDRAIGIENDGTYTAVDPPSAQLAGLTALCAYTCLQYGIAPSQLYGHRDYKDTACPGDRLYKLLPTLRRRVGALLTAPGATAAAVADPPTWPLLRVADRGPAVLAAQHLLRNAGVAGVPADGAYARSTADGVLTFQRAHGLERTGMIGGASWPLLAVPVRMGQGGEAEAAVRALLGRRQGAGEWAVPTRVQTATWQRLLGTG